MSSGILLGTNGCVDKECEQEQGILNKQKIEAADVGKQLDNHFMNNWFLKNLSTL
jgi:hypothetical protein